ncbi:hypothetical protein [Streptomyces sp. NPDC005799]|uniref:hypothetical protein n=1 Tax=Streptomyces sp. NPDC005799 TaxID=3154678 RepID=UPI0033ED3916
MNRSTIIQKSKKAGTAIALTATVALGGIAFAAPANAAELGRVEENTAPTSLSWHDVWASAWSQAYSHCKANYPETKSVSMVDYFQLDHNPKVHSTWSCRDN